MTLFSLGATWINSLLNTIWMSICRVIYIFINWLYQVFETVANVNLFSEEVFKDITSRMYIVMGIAMLFIFAYNLILMVINPDDKKGTGATTKLVKETIISLTVVILLPTIFNWMYAFQGHVLSSNIIGQVIMGGIGSTSGDTSNCAPDDYECSCDFSDFDELKEYGTGSDNNMFADGFTEDTTDVYQNLIDACNSYKNDLTDSQRGAYSVAPTIFSAFYRPAGYDMNECEEYLKTGSSSLIDSDQEKQICANFFYDVKMSKYKGNINPFVNDSYLLLTMSTDEGLIEFDWLFAILAGGMAVWMFLCYAMEIGVRVAKLGVLQIISPIAVMMRIVPGQKEKMYDKWFQELTNTYLDVFIRLVIIFFSLFAISLVPDVISTLFSSIYSGESNWFLQTLSAVIVILGILKFAQEAPDLLKTFFGNSGKFALRSPGKQLGDNKLAMGAMGGIGGAASTFAKNRGVGSRLAGAASGFVRGARAGAQSKDFKGLRYNTSAAVDRAITARNERKARKEYDEKNGYMASRRKQLSDSWKKFTSSDSYASLAAKKAEAEKTSNAFDAIIKAAEGKIEEVPDLFSYNGRTYGDYLRKARSATSEHENFSTSSYARDYKKDHNCSDAEAIEAAKREKDRLNLEAKAASENARLVKEAIADAIITKNGQEIKVPTRAAKDVDMQHVEIDKEGFAKIVKDSMKDGIKEGMVTTEKAVAGLNHKIDEANGLYDKNFALFSEDIRGEIEKAGGYTREINGKLKDEVGNINAQLAQLNQLQNSDKK